jgi:hypothetical protein
MGVALALAGVAVAVSARSGSDEAARPVEPAANTHAATPGPLPALSPARTRGLGCTFEVGGRFAWRFEVSVRLDLERGALAPAGTPKQGVDVVESGAEGALEALVLAVTPAGEAVVALRATRFSDTPAEAASSASAAENWTADLRKPVLLRVDDRCRTLAGARHRDTSILAWDRLGRLLDRFQFMAPPEPAAPAEDGTARPYTTRHTDTHGASVVSNRHVAGPGRGALSRRRLRYEIADPRVQVAIVRAQSTLTLGDAVWFEGLDESQVVHTRMSGAPAFQSAERARFAAVAPESSAFAGQDLDLSHYVWGRPDAAALSTARDALGPAGLRGEPLETAWGHYLASTEKDWFGAQKRLRAWLRANPEGAAALAAGLRAGRFAPREAAALTLALAKSGSPEALSALEGLAADTTLPENLRTQAVSALADAPHPTLGTVDTLVQIADRANGPTSLQDLVGSAATMSLGNLVEGQIAGAPADAARAYLESRLHAADADRVAEALWAVGNTGDPAFLDTVATKAASDDPDLRAAAMHAARKMKHDPEARALVTERLRVETHPEVAAEAAAAQREQLGASGRLSAHELNLYRSKLVGAPEPLRREIVLTLGAVATQQPEARQILAEWYPLEESLPVRQLIGRFVPAAMLP